MSSYSTPTVEQVDNIASIADAVLRNLLITQCYCELSATFAQNMGQSANWCTFATWASKQAGQTIRQEDLKRTLEAMLKNEPAIEAALVLVHTLAVKMGAKQSLDELRESTIGVLVARAADHASIATGRGNKKVFEEIGREFSRFIATCMNDSAYVTSHIETFCGQLRPGPPPDGQAYLQNAFTCYYQALFEKDDKKKTELNFLANLQVGWHEQNRLQPEIAEALNLAAIDLQKIKNKLLDKLFAGSDFWVKVRLFFQRIFSKKSLLDKAIEELLEQVQHRIRGILTAHLMTLTIPPKKRLQLGKDLSMPYPANLKVLINPDLRALLSKIDPTADSLQESGAADWAILAERMHFIADLFRCCHTSKELFDAAFTAEQINAMREGKLPQGEL